MKKRMVFVLATMSVFLLLGSVASAAPTGFADESSGPKTCTTPGQVAWTLACQGDYCAAIESGCWTTSVPLTTNTTMTDYYSEEQGQFFCPSGYMVNGFDVQGWDGYGDNISLSCLQTDGWVVDPPTCTWSDWISEEVINTQPSPTPWSTPNANYVACPGATSVIVGMECNGPWCDNMRIQCCDFVESTIVPINIGPEHTETFFTADPSVVLEVDELTFGWTPNDIVIGFSSVDGQVLDGITVTVDGDMYNLTGWWDTIWLDFTTVPFNLTVDTGGPSRDLRTTWWVQ
jgi:hypothetical protein